MTDFEYYMESSKGNFIKDSALFQYSDLKSNLSQLDKLIKKQSKESDSAFWDDLNEDFIELNSVIAKLLKNYN